MEKFFSIKKNICYLNDLGFLFLDNGSKTIRMTIQTMAKAFEVKQFASELVAAHPEFFEWVEDARLADERCEHGSAI